MKKLFNLFCNVFMLLTSSIWALPAIMITDREFLTNDNILSGIWEYFKKVMNKYMQ